MIWMLLFLIALITTQPSTLVQYEHQGRPYVSPTWAVMQTGEETVLADGTRYVRNQ